MSCAACEVCIEQPPFWEARTPDGVFIKQMYLPETGTVVPQHAHVYDHTSMLAMGKIRVWADDKLVGDFSAPYPLFIAAKVKHRFQSLVPNTLIYCIHNVSRTGNVEIHAEHHLR